MSAFGHYFTLFFLFALLGIPDQSFAREWTNQAGKTFEGELVDFDDEKAWIKRQKDGKTFSVPLELLSQKDQDYIKEAATGNVKVATPLDKLNNTTWVGKWNNEKAAIIKIKNRPTPKTVDGKKVLKNIPHMEFLDAHPNESYDHIEVIRIHPNRKGIYEFQVGLIVLATENELVVQRTNLGLAKPEVGRFVRTDKNLSDPSTIPWKTTSWKEIAIKNFIPIRKEVSKKLLDEDASTNKIKNGDFQKQSLAWKGDIKAKPYLYDKKDFHGLLIVKRKKTSFRQRFTVRDARKITLKYRVSPSIDYEGLGYEVRLTKDDRHYTYYRHEELLLDWQKKKLVFEELENAKGVTIEFISHGGSSGVLAFDDISVEIEK